MEGATGMGAQRHGSRQLTPGISFHRGLVAEGKEKGGGRAGKAKLLACAALKTGAVTPSRRGLMWSGPIQGAAPGDSARPRPRSRLVDGPGRADVGVDVGGVPRGIRLAVDERQEVVRLADGDLVGALAAGKVETDDAVAGGVGEGGGGAVAGDQGAAEVLSLREGGGGGGGQE